MCWTIGLSALAVAGRSAVTQRRLTSAAITRLEVSRGTNFTITPYEVARWPRRSNCGDGPLIVGARVRRPQNGGRSGRGAARPVQSRSGAAVDDLVAAITKTVEPPLLVVAAVPRRLPRRHAVGGVAPAVGDHPIGPIDDAVIAIARIHQLPLQVGAAVVIPLLQHSTRRDAPTAVQHKSAGDIGDPHPRGGQRSRRRRRRARALELCEEPPHLALGPGPGTTIACGAIHWSGGVVFVVRGPYDRVAGPAPRVGSDDVRKTALPRFWRILGGATVVPDERVAQRPAQRDIEHSVPDAV